MPDPEHKVVKKFYPNPAVSYIIFDLEKEPNTTYRLEIFSFLGKMVKDIPDMVDHYTSTSAISPAASIPSSSATNPAALPIPASSR